MNKATTPVLIGVGQHVDRSNSANGATPVEMMAQASLNASEDAGGRRLLERVDTLAAVGLTVDEAQVKSPVSNMVRNVPQAVARELNINPRQQFYTATGGNTPQMLVNYFAQEIAKGKTQTVLLSGGEALSTMRLRFNHWSKLLLPKGKWKDKAGPVPDRLGVSRAGTNAYENRYGLNLPARVYPLYENALRAHYGHDINEHQEMLAEIFSNLTKVAANNPHAWFREHREAEELIEVSDTNRMVSFPYPKRLNSMLMVNQSAAILMTNVETAEALGVSRDKWVFLHGYASGSDIWHITERPNFYESVAIRDLSQRALKMANKQIDDIAAFDLYSCFPSAVQIACDALGIDHNDSRGLTLTGGLPYFGGPGNNYAMHAIAEAVNWARSKPTEFVYVNANGWYLTKHAVGIYSASEPTQATDYDNHDYRPNAANQVAVNENLLGAARIETYTVLFDKSNRSSQGIIVARGEQGDRALALCEEPSLMQSLIESEGVGIEGNLYANKGRTHFEF